MGDLFNEGIYDIQIAVSKVPMLSWAVDASLRWKDASHIMRSNPVCIQMQEKVSVIVDILKQTQHNGFPVVDEISEVCTGTQYINMSNNPNMFYSWTIRGAGCAVLFCAHN